MKIVEYFQHYYTLPDDTLLEDIFNCNKITSYYSANV